MMSQLDFAQVVLPCLLLLQCRSRDLNPDERKLTTP